jgi:hypothetical protein
MEPIVEKKPTEGMKLAILVALAILCIGLEIGIHLFARTAVGYTHIFYLLLVLAGIWYHRLAVWVAVALAAATIPTSLYVGDFGWATLLRGSMFIVVAYVVGTLSAERDRGREQLLQQKQEIEEKHAALIGYISEVALRLKNPVAILRDNLAGIIASLGKDNPDLESARMELTVQVSHADQILVNLQELNKAVVECHEDIPQAYREFLNR